MADTDPSNLQIEEGAPTTSSQWDVDLITHVEDLPSDLAGDITRCMEQRLADAATVIALVGQRLRLQCRLDAPTAAEALRRVELLQARALSEAGMAVPVLERVQISVLGTAQHSTQAAGHLLELVGVAELAELLKVSKQRVSLMAARAQLPRPAAQLRAGPVWTKEAITSFLPAWPRKPGRPRRQQMQALSRNQVSRPSTQTDKPKEMMEMPQRPPVTAHKPSKPAQPSKPVTKPGRPPRPAAVDEAAIWATKPAAVQQAYRVHR